MHLFLVSGAQLKLRDQSLTTQLREANAKIFVEDQAVVEAQQRAINELPDHALRTLNIDAGSMRARRIIDDMIASEARTVAA